VIVPLSVVLRHEFAGYSNRVTAATCSSMNEFFRHSVVSVTTPFSQQRFRNNAVTAND